MLLYNDRAVVDVEVRLGTLAVLYWMDTSGLVVIGKGGGRLVQIGGADLQMDRILTQRPVFNAQDI